MGTMAGMRRVGEERVGAVHVGDEGPLVLFEFAPK